MDVFLELYQLQGNQEEKQAIHTDMYHLNPDNLARYFCKITVKRYREIVTPSLFFLGKDSNGTLNMLREKITVIRLTFEMSINCTHKC